MPSPPRRDPHIAWPVKLLAVVAVGGAVYAGIDGIRGGGGETGEGSGADQGGVARTGSLEVGPPDRAWSFGAFPESYEVTARVAFTGVQTTEVVRVLPPFASRTEAFRGPAAGAGPVDEREFGFGLLATRSAEGTVTVLQVPPAIAGHRPAAAIVDAEELGLVVRREVREVAGRRCQVWRTGGERAGTTFLPPDRDDYIDLCIDGSGLLLEEWQVDGGCAIRQRVATAVRTSGVDAPALERLPREITLPTSKGGGSVIAIETDARPVGPFLEISSPPEGYRHQGRYTVVPPHAGLAEGGDRGKAVAATTDVFVRGVDAIIVERGGVLDLSDPWTPDPRLPDVDLGPAIGTGELVPGTSGGEVRALLGSGRYLRVHGSADLDTLAGVARSLTAVQDGSGIGFSD